MNNPADHGDVVRPARVVFDCPGAAALFDHAAEKGIGGAEVRAITFARKISQRPDVALRFVVASDTPQKSRPHDRFEVVFEPRRSLGNTCRKASAWEKTQRLSAKLTGSIAQRVAGLPKRNAFFEHLNADVLCTFGVTNRTASVVRSARRVGCATVVCLTSDRTLDDIQRHGRRDRGAYGELGSLCRYVLRTADAIVVQKKEQQARILQHLHRAAWLVRNPIDLAFRPSPLDVVNGDELGAWLESDAPFVLWVGRADTFSKRADVAFELARRCQHVRFLMVMNRDEHGVYEDLLQSRPPNVLVIERVAFSQIESLYQRATLLINTSDAEGFPNAWLQAGKYGVPTISLNVDPDNMLVNGRVGYFANRSLANAVSMIERWIQKREDYVLVSERVRSYVAEHHDLNTVSDELWRCLSSVSGLSPVTQPTRIAS